jgi:tripartite-type tricarboxylate transporter receptor subunit TctC
VIQSKRRRLLFGSGAAIGFALARPVFAQAGYPTKPIKIIAPVQPGGGVDLVARTIADRLGLCWVRRSS